MHNGGGRGRKIEQAKDFGAAFRRTVRELRPYLPRIILASLCAIGGAILSIVAPNQLAKITDLISAGIAPEQAMALDRIGRIALLLLGLYFGSALLELSEGLIMARVSNRFAQNLRRNISEKINRLPLRYFDKHQSGDILSRVTNDIDTLTMNLNNTISSAVSAMTLLLGTVLMMFVTNWLLALTAMASTLIGFRLMVAILKKSQKYFVERQVALGKLNAHIEEVYSGINIVKAYNGKAQMDKKFDRLNRRVYRANQRSQFLSGLMHPIMAFIGNFGYVAVCVVGALLTAHNLISFGIIVAFIAYVRLFTSPLSELAQITTSLQSAIAAAERVFEFVDETEMSDQRKVSRKLQKEKVRGDISFRHVRFGYDAEKTIIKDFNIDIKAGQKVAIVGPTGAGKTTMVNLLMKFYEIQAGEILIDGTATSELTRENVHELFTMVLQDTWMFEGSVRENIAYNRTNVSDQRIMEICEQIGLAHFIRTLPNGLNTQLSDDAVSAGQKQLITIARGMVEDAPFLILDEATSNVDTRTEELVQAAMDKLMEGRTSFIIAHRLSTIKNADLILVMNEGDIVESGNHQTLMAKNGFYAELYNSQFSL